MLAEGMERSITALRIRRCFIRYWIGVSPIVRLKHRRHSRSLRSADWAMSLS